MTGNPGVDDILDEWPVDRILRYADALVGERIALASIPRLF